MVSQPYVDGITDTVTHSITSSLTADRIAADEDTVSVSVICPDRWFLGDFAVVTSRDGRAFAGEVEGMDVCTGEVTIRGTGRAARLPGLRGRGQRRGRPHAAVKDHRPGTSRCARPGRDGYRRITRSRPERVRCAPR